MVKVKVYNSRIIKGFQFYRTIEGGRFVFRSLDGSLEQSIANTSKGKHFIKAKFAFKGVKYLTPSELVGLTSVNMFRQWAYSELDKAGFNY